MIKKYICLFILFFICGGVVLAYEQYKPSVFEYFNTGKYFNKSKQDVKMYKNYNEYNKNECKKFFCYIPDGSDIGYLLERSPHGAVGYKWINDGYLNVEKQRCHRTQDNYPVVKSFAEAKNYKD